MISSSFYKIYPVAHNIKEHDVKVFYDQYLFLRTKMYIGCMKRVITNVEIDTLSPLLLVLPTHLFVFRCSFFFLLCFSFSFSIFHFPSFFCFSFSVFFQTLLYNTILSRKHSPISFWCLWCRIEHSLKKFLKLFVNFFCTYGLFFLLAKSQQKILKVDLYNSKMWSFNLDFHFFLGILPFSTLFGAEPVKKPPCIL